MLAGNPLAVVLGADRLAPQTMQAIAREMNLSETTFVLPAQAGGAARVRIFTPQAELPFAGHPTIGTAWVLLDEGLVPESANQLTLEERIGPVVVRTERKESRLILWMNHPRLQFGEVLAERQQVAAALGLSASDLADEVPLQIMSTGVPFLFVALRDPRVVDAAAANAERLEKILARYGLPPVFIFAKQESHHLYSRMLGAHSLAGVVEDPATGSASGPVGGFAVHYGLVPRAPSVDIVSEQGTRMGRQSLVRIKLAYEDQDQPVKIEVGGSVVPAVTGILAVAE